ncbi:hypothetical protein [Planotetraspora kaengkrachanensis]|uniref:Uncharacterized protein n=1 Tax=Planotetraspora kaengkrachanensis TaxID=575193 RepID=A0A8J3Q144_9ACTN|nr:hypothetical protein [Planotetraspora kaengkrachanensis]GIG84994.1 hypothetical protein Pka01_81210 [Planotetraspora kaengkrachanensis]
MARWAALAGRKGAEGDDGFEAVGEVGGAAEELAEQVARGMRLEPPLR